jgi:hypothetical protein
MAMVTHHSALEFVKIMSHILGLNTALANEVHNIRKNCLKLLHIGEFDPAA